MVQPRGGGGAVKEGRPTAAILPGPELLSMAAFCFPTVEKSRQQREKKLGGVNSPPKLLPRPSISHRAAAAAPH